MTRGTQDQDTFGIRFIRAIVIMVVILIFSLLTEFNLINMCCEILPFEEEGTLVKAKLEAVENYKKDHYGKYDHYNIGGQADLTVSFEMNGVGYNHTYENVYIYSSEANMDKYTHIYVYVLDDLSDIQTKWIVDYFSERARGSVIFYAVLVGLYIACCIVIEIAVFREKKTVKKR